MNTKVINMLEQSIIAQIAFNNKATPDWIMNPPDYRRAAIQEASELINHYPWKWWAKTPETTDFQKKLEMADIFCFELSNIIGKGMGVFRTLGIPDDHASSARTLHKIILTGLDQTSEFHQSIMEASHEAVLQNYIARNLLEGMNIAHSFVPILPKFGLNLYELCKIHQGKMVLNNFRKDHGYKEGTYFKFWDGKEDNHWLEFFIGEFEKDCNSKDDESGIDYNTYIYDRLKNMYGDGDTYLSNGIA